MQPLNFNDEEKRQAKQTFDLCRVVDKLKTGQIVSKNFNRIAQVCGLKADEELIRKHTLSGKGIVNYEELAQEIMQKK